MASGLFVFLMWQIGWNGFVVLNMETSPAVPWHVPAGLLYLWLGFRYFGGRWAPASTSRMRR